MSPYRTMDQPYRKNDSHTRPRRKITEKEKDERKSSAESFRGVQFVALIFGAIASAVMFFHMYTMTPGKDHTLADERAFGMSSGMLAVVAFGIGLAATRRIANQQSFINEYWEQQSEKE